MCQKRCWISHARKGIQYLLQYEWIVDERCVKTIEELKVTWKEGFKATNEYPTKSLQIATTTVWMRYVMIQDKITKSKIKTFKGLLIDQSQNKQQATLTVPVNTEVFAEIVTEAVACI